MFIEIIVLFYWRAPIGAQWSRAGDPLRSIVHFAPTELSHCRLRQFHKRLVPTGLKRSETAG